MISTEVLDEVLESLLFISGDGLKISDIAEQMNVDKKNIEKSIKNLKEKYSGKCGIHLITYNGKVQFASNPSYVDLISLVLNPIKEKDLSSAALETIAIIAYRQPVTRLEVEQIRGNNSEYTIQLLLKHNLIEVVGRKDSVGKPLLFGTTEEFLKRFQIESVDQLPDYNTLLESLRILETEGVKKEEDAGSLYNHFEIPEESAQESAQTVNEELPQEETPDFLSDEEVVKVE
jgi:segregation and condensation protein B